jgi:hypothetical protein
MSPSQTKAGQLSQVGGCAAQGKLHSTSARTCNSINVAPLFTVMLKKEQNRHSSRAYLRDADCLVAPVTGSLTVATFVTARFAEPETPARENNGMHLSFVGTFERLTCCYASQCSLVVIGRVTGCVNNAGTNCCRRSKSGHLWRCACAALQCQRLSVTFVRPAPCTLPIADDNCCRQSTVPCSI